MSTWRIVEYQCVSCFFFSRRVEHGHADGGEDDELEEQDRSDIADVMEDVGGDGDAEIADVDVADRPCGEHRLSGAALPDPAGEGEEDEAGDERGPARGEEGRVEDEPEVGLGDRDVEERRGARIEDELRDDLLTGGAEHPGASQQEPDEDDPGDDGESFEYGQHGLPVVLASWGLGGRAGAGQAVSPRASTARWAAPAEAAVTVSTAGQAPIFFASGWESPKPPR